jgi:hypothetical protein
MTSLSESKEKLIEVNKAATRDLADIRAMLNLSRGDPILITEEAFLKRLVRACDPKFVLGADRDTIQACWDLLDLISNERVPS